MTIPRFFISKSAIDKGSGTIRFADKSVARQLNKILRLGQGSKVQFLDGSGKVYLCQLLDGKEDLVLAEIVSSSLVKPAAPKISVALPPLKHDRFDWALEKLTELGVSEVIPILVQRSVVRPQAATHGAQVRGSKTNRWLNIVREASEQCERTLLPDVVAVTPFTEFLQFKPEKQELRLLCSERAKVAHLSKMLCNLGDQARGLERIVIAIGAEGGFTEDEQQLAQSSGFILVSLGSLILRAETAAIYALSIVASHFMSLN